MELTLISILGSAVAGACSLIFMWQNNRIKTLEQNSFSEKATRQLIEDKLGGIHNDLKEIKESINKLFNLYIDNVKATR